MRLVKRDLNLRVARRVSVLGGKDDDGDSIAGAVAQFRQKIETGGFTERDIEHGKVEVMSRKRTACFVDGSRPISRYRRR